MRPLSHAALLEAWEGGHGQSLVQASLALLAAASPELTAEQLAQLTIGQRDGRLMTLREWSFGSQVVSTSTCPDCGSALELTFDLADVRSVPTAEPPPNLHLSLGEYEVAVRLPNSLDTLAAIAVADAVRARRVLVERCLVSVERRGQLTSGSGLPEAVLEIVESEMGKADPDGDIQLSTTCPDCGHCWSGTFDIGYFFWTELSGWAQRLLYNVHALASAYGWREADILALSPWRRQFYLEAVGR